MNLKDFYSQKQAMKILGFDHKMQILRWRNIEEPFMIRLCKRPFYLRHDVDKYMESLIKAAPDSNLRGSFTINKFEAHRFDIDLDDWLPRCRALKIWPNSHELLYAVSGVRNPLYTIRVKKAYGQYFFSREDMERFTKKQVDI